MTEKKDRDEEIKKKKKKKNKYGCCERGVWASFRLPLK